jgi:hypothetical protein
MGKESTSLKTAAGAKQNCNFYSRSTSLTGAKIYFSVTKVRYVVAIEIVKRGESLRNQEQMYTNCVCTGFVSTACGLELITFDGGNCFHSEMNK